MSARRARIVSGVKDIANVGGVVESDTGYNFGKRRFKRLAYSTTGRIISRARL